MQKFFKLRTPILIEGKMSKSHDKLTPKLIELLEKDPGQTVKQLAEQLDVNRTFLAGYLKALENQGYVKSKKIGPAKVYFVLGTKR
ncbi:MAG: winged helix-turn-helix domain-containing protein [Candidatus Bathyarchaeia archaeon]